MWSEAAHHHPCAPDVPPAAPTVSDTKKKFFDSYRKPVAHMYSTVVLELLVQQHFVRFGKNYRYNEVRRAHRGACCYALLHAICPSAAIGARQQFGGWLVGLAIRRSGWATVGPHR